jgi:hypothetical protein
MDHRESLGGRYIVQAYSRAFPVHIITKMVWPRYNIMSKAVTMMFSDCVKIWKAVCCGLVGCDAMWSCRLPAFFDPWDLG